ncbi:GntR family transcriptional regulator [Metabacillus dongyingensis]|uniref:GntR family transcriptional regulator n=1 Tax=Metabacillus dongyingensis TaxID=2874282 RepID=UPI003B8C7D07
MLNKYDVIPLYVQLNDKLREKILNGELKEGEALPSENQLMQEYSITRTTIRRAVDELVKEGLVEKEQGKGVFVRLRQTKQNLWNFQGFTDLSLKKNQQPVTRVLKKEIITENNTVFLKLERLRGTKSNEKTTWLTIDCSFLPIDVFKGIDRFDFEAVSLYQTLRNDYQIFPHHVVLDINPIMCDDKMCERLELLSQIPLLEARGTVYSKDGMEIEKIHNIYGPHFQFKLNQYI